MADPISLNKQLTAALIAKDTVCNLQVATQWPVYFLNVSILMNVHKIVSSFSTFFFA